MGPRRLLRGRRIEKGAVSLYDGRDVAVGQNFALSQQYAPVAHLFHQRDGVRDKDDARALLA